MAQFLPVWMLNLAIDEQEIEAFSENVSDTLEQWKGLEPGQILDNVVKGLAGVGPGILAALVVFLVGSLVIRGTSGLVKRLLSTSKVDKTLHYFIRSTVKIVLYVLVIITCLGVLGVPLTPMITALGAAGLALSLAVQDSLSNLAGGLSILLNHPFAIGNFVQIGDNMGTVKQIRLVYTLISSVDNKHIYLPNGDVAKAVITNFSAETTRRLDLTFSVRGDSDIAAAKKIVEEAVGSCEQILQEPEPIVRYSGQTYLLVNIACLVWVQASDYFAANAYLIEQVRTKLSAAGFVPSPGDQLWNLEH